jgi:hypothetical protein
MVTVTTVQARSTVLTGRRSECDVLDGLLDAVRAGESRALVLRGEPGVGKTALLDYVVEQAADCRIARAAGVQSELELAFAGLHQLLAPTLEDLGRLPVPQRDALRTVFGLSDGPTPDRFFVGLAVLNLLSDAAEERPLVCVVDDAQWLDRESMQVLAFVARRVEADSVGLVFAAREPTGDVAGLPELLVGALSEVDALALLDSVLTAPLDAQVRGQIVSETRGIPLAMLELLRELSPAELAGGFGFPGGVSRSANIEETFARRLDALPPETRLLVPPSCSGSQLELQRLQPRRACSSSARACSFAIHSCARLPTVRRPKARGRKRIERWRRRPIRRSIRIARPGTVPRPRSAPMRSSPPSSSGLLAGRTGAAVWLRRRPSSSARPR